MQFFVSFVSQRRHLYSFFSLSEQSHEQVLTYQYWHLYVQLSYNWLLNVEKNASHSLAKWSAGET